MPENELVIRLENDPEQPPAVGCLRLTLRRYPVAGWAAVIFGGLVFLAAAANQVIDLLRHLGALR